MNEKKRRKIEEREYQAYKAQKASKKKEDSLFPEMQNKIDELGELEKKYIAEAQEAYSNGDKQTYLMARKFLKAVVGRKRIFKAMMMTFEMEKDMNKMNAIVGDFLTVVDAMVEGQAQVKTIDVASLQKKIEAAGRVSEGQAESLMSVFEGLTESMEGIDVIAGSSLKDEDIDRMIASGIASDMSSVPAFGTEAEADPLSAVRKILNGDAGEGD